MKSTAHNFSLTEIASAFPGILLDAYGVFWGGNETGLLPGGKEAMAHLIATGKIVGVLSNSTQLVAKEQAKLQKHGIIEGTHYHFLLTSGEISQQLFRNKALPFKTPRHTYILSGSAHPQFSSPQTLFEGSSYQETSQIDEADFILVSIPHLNGEDQTNPELFRKEVKRLIKSGLPMVCTNPDHYAHEGNPARLVVRQGTIAAMYQEEGGEVFFIGKPHATAYQMAMECFKNWNINDPSQVLMIGDTPETDIRGARQCGMSSVLLTHTGIMAERIALHGMEKAVATFVKNDHPTYYLKNFSL